MQPPSPSPPPAKAPCPTKYGLGGAALLGGHAAATGALPVAQGDRYQHLGGAAAGADQLGALVVPVGAGRHLEEHVAVADDAAQFAFVHGWLLLVPSPSALRRVADGITRM